MHIEYPSDQTWFIKSLSISIFKRILWINKNSLTQSRIKSAISGVMDFSRWFGLKIPFQCVFVGSRRVEVCICSNLWFWEHQTFRLTSLNILLIFDHGCPFPKVSGHHENKLYLECNIFNLEATKYTFRIHFISMNIWNAK